MDLERYQLPMKPIPVAAEAVIKLGVVKGGFPGPETATQVLMKYRENFPDGVIRDGKGKALVLCTTQMPGVTPEMVDWWFGWHMTDSARYQLWHPLAHKKSCAKYDRTTLSDDRCKYIGNVSYVDEYIGESLKRLAIAFHSPEEYGFLKSDLAQNATAICAKTSDRQLAIEGGSLVHLVLRTDTGSEMRSAFWLGEVKLQIPVLDGLLNPIINLPAVRRRKLPDRFLIDLFMHCSEEMNHLARFLPELYADINVKK